MYLAASFSRAASRALCSACSSRALTYRFLATKPLATACSDRAARALRHHLRAAKPRAPDCSATVAARIFALRSATTRSRQNACVFFKDWRGFKTLLIHAPTAVFCLNPGRWSRPRATLMNNRAKQFAICSLVGTLFYALNVKRAWADGFFSVADGDS